MDPQTALLNLVVSRLGTDVPTTQILMRISVLLAQQVNTFPQLKGREKMDLVLRVLRESLAIPTIKERVPVDVMPVLLDTINNVIPETITLAIEASRGGYTLKKPSIGCLASLAVLLCRTVAAAAPSSEVGKMAAQASSVAAMVADAIPDEKATEPTLTIRNPMLDQDKPTEQQE
jgi:hypothetical protein